MQKRLILSRPVAPFESAWLIFLKLQYLNLTTPQSIFKLLKKKGSNRPVDLWSKDWLDEDLFSERAGLSRQVIEEAFIPEGGKNYFSRSVRHCPECIRLRYHCSLFQLKFIDKCPWHGLDLEECSSCSTAVKNIGLFRSSKIPGRVVFSCGHIVIRPGEIGLTSVPEELSGKIKLFCSSLRSWLLSAESVSKSCIPHIYSYAGSEAGVGLRDIAISYLECRVSKAPWDFGHRSIPIKLVNIGEQEYCDQSVPIAELTSSIKSLRRHLMKNYIGKHKACYKTISQYNLDGSRTLILEETCQLGLTLFLWDVLCCYFSCKELVFDYSRFGHLVIPSPQVLREYSLRYILNILYVRFIDILSGLGFHLRYRRGLSLVVSLNGNLTNPFEKCFCIDGWRDVFGRVVCADPYFLAREGDVNCKSMEKNSPFRADGYYFDNWHYMAGRFDILRLYSMAAHRTRHIYFNI